LWATSRIAPRSRSSAAPLSQCRVCLGLALQFVKYVHGEYRHGDVPLFRCRECSCFFTTPGRFEDATDLSAVNSIEWHLRGLPYNLKKVRALFSLIQRRGWAARADRRFLDIGCAVGHSLKEAESWDYEAYGFEPEARAAMYAREVNRVNVTHGYFAYGALDGMKFDVIMLDNVLEHVPEPRALVYDISRTLRPDGIIFIGVPPVDWLHRMTSISWVMPSSQPTVDWRGIVSRIRFVRGLSTWDTFGYPDGHVNYFSARGIEMLVRDCGLRVEQQFHHQSLRAQLFPFCGLTTGFWILRPLR
jgi:SAM-dependent methyltransferase